METSTFFLNFLAAVAAALVGGLVAQRLRMPTLIGYILGGIIVGPHTPGFRSDITLVRELASIGVTFLMFAVGTEVSLRVLRHVRSVALIGGVAQVAVTAALGYLISRLFGFGAVPSVFFGSLIAMSSTIVVVKVLSERGQLHSLHGRIALAIALVQDFLVVPLIVVLPALAASNESVMVSTLWAVAKATLLVGGSYVIGIKVMPWVFHRIADTGSRELFLFTAVSVALGAAVGTEELGVSSAVGAFIAGLVIGESRFRGEVESLFAPLRDLFAIFFFVSVGMLLDPIYVFHNGAVVAATVALIVVGKVIITATIPWLFGYGPRVSVAVALSLAQVGEMSFILAGVGLLKGIVSEEMYSLIIAAGVISIILTPLVLGRGLALFDRLTRVPVLGRLLVVEGRPSQQMAIDPLPHPVIVCGFGRVGGKLVELLSNAKVPYVVVENDPFVVTKLQRGRFPYVFGDGTSKSVLEHANVKGARGLVVAIPDFPTVSAVVLAAKRLNPGIWVLARADSEEEMKGLRKIGADQVVQPEFEAAVELGKRVLEAIEPKPEHLEAPGDGKASAHRAE